MAGRVLPSERPEHVIYESMFNPLQIGRGPRLMYSPKSTGRSGYSNCFQFPCKPLHPQITNGVKLMTRSQCSAGTSVSPLQLVILLSGNQVQLPLCMSLLQGEADCRCAIAITKLIEPILIRNGLPGAAAALVCGDIEVGKELVGSGDIPLGMCLLSPTFEQA